MSGFESINFKRGYLPLIILSLLSQEDMYGYQIVQEIVRQSKGKFITQEGSLYPVLYRLLGGEYISSYDVFATKRMRHIYYHLENKGREYLEELQRQFDDMTQGIRFILREETPAEE